MDWLPSLLLVPLVKPVMLPHDLLWKREMVEKLVLGAMSRLNLTLMVSKTWHREIARIVVLIAFPP